MNDDVDVELRICGISLSPPVVLPTGARLILEVAEHWVHVVMEREGRAPLKMWAVRRPIPETAKAAPKDGS